MCVCVWLCLCFTILQIPLLFAHANLCYLADAYLIRLLFASATNEQ